MGEGRAHSLGWEGADPEPPEHAQWGAQAAAERGTRRRQRERIAAVRLPRLSSGHLVQNVVTSQGRTSASPLGHLPRWVQAQTNRTAQKLPRYSHQKITGCSLRTGVPRWPHGQQTSGEAGRPAHAHSGQPSAHPEAGLRAGPWSSPRCWTPRQRRRAKVSLSSVLTLQTRAPVHPAGQALLLHTRSLARRDFPPLFVDSLWLFVVVLSSVSCLLLPLSC